MPAKLPRATSHQLVHWVQASAVPAKCREPRHISLSNECRHLRSLPSAASHVTSICPMGAGIGGPCQVLQATSHQSVQWVQASAIPAEDAARDTGEHWAWQESLEVEPAPLKEVVLAEQVAVPVQELWALLFRVRPAGRS